MKKAELGTSSSIILLALVFVAGAVIGAWGSSGENLGNEKAIYAAMDGFSNFTCLTINDSELGFPSIGVRYVNETATPSFKIKCKKNEVWFEKSLVLGRVN